MIFAGATTEKEVKNDAYQRQERQHQHPCNGFCRLAMLHQHRNHCHNGYHGVGCKNYPVYVNHSFSFLNAYFLSITPQYRFPICVQARCACLASSLSLPLFPLLYSNRSLPTDLPATLSGVVPHSPYGNRV